MNRAQRRAQKCSGRDLPVMTTVKTPEQQADEIVKGYNRKELALIELLLNIEAIDVEDGKLIQHLIVPYARRHEGIRWWHHPELPGCVFIDQPFNPETWEGFPIGVLSQ